MTPRSQNNTYKNLKIVQINVNSLIRISKRYDLQVFLDANDPDIVLLNETKLNPRHNVIFKNYNIIRKDRIGATRGGGTAILIKNNINYYNYDNRIIHSLDALETCAIKVPIDSNSILFIICAYYPAGNSNTIRADLQKLFDSMNLQNSNNYYVLAGDLNCKHTDWGNTVNNTKGNSLKEWLAENEIEFRCRLYASIAPSFPRSGSYLDLYIADSRLNILRGNELTNCLRTLDYDSDHNAIELIVNIEREPNVMTSLNRDTSFKFNFKKTNWKKFVKVILQKIRIGAVIPSYRN